jgi:hypothetical protein
MSVLASLEQLRKKFSHCKGWALLPQRQRRSNAALPRLNMRDYSSILIALSALFSLCFQDWVRATFAG